MGDVDIIGEVQTSTTAGNALSEDLLASLSGKSHSEIPLPGSPGIIQGSKYVVIFQGQRNMGLDRVK